jgi:hypothetical protein
VPRSELGPSARSAGCIALLLVLGATALSMIGMPPDRPDFYGAR